MLPNPEKTAMSSKWEKKQTNLLLFYFSNTLYQLLPESNTHILRKACIKSLTFASQRIKP